MKKTILNKLKHSIVQTMTIAAIFCGCFEAAESMPAGYKAGTVNRYFDAKNVKNSNNTGDREAVEIQFSQITRVDQASDYDTIKIALSDAFCFIQDNKSKVPEKKYKQKMLDTVKGSDVYNTMTQTLQCSKTIMDSISIMVNNEVEKGVKKNVERILESIPADIPGGRSFEDQPFSNFVNSIVESMINVAFNTKQKENIQFDVDEVLNNAFKRVGSERLKAARSKKSTYERDKVIEEAFKGVTKIQTISELLVFVNDIYAAASPELVQNKFSSGIWGKLSSLCGLETDGESKQVEFSGNPQNIKLVDMCKQCAINKRRMIQFIRFC